MKPKILLIVQSTRGDAEALAKVACYRGADLGLAVETVTVTAMPSPGQPLSTESVTALVPAEYANQEHHAWCFLCQLSLLSCGIHFSLLVVGADADYRVARRQRQLLARPPLPQTTPPSASCAA